MEEISNLNILYRLWYRLWISFDFMDLIIGILKLFCWKLGTSSTMQQSDGWVVGLH